MTLNEEACTLYELAIPRLPQLKMIHRPGVNEFADDLRRNGPDLKE